MNNMDAVVNGEYAILTVKYPPEGRNRRASHAEPLIEQYNYRATKHNPKHCPVMFNALDTSREASVLKRADRQPLHLDIVVEIEHYTHQGHNNKNETQYSEIRFYREPFSPFWLDALSHLFETLPSEERIIEKNISYVDILDRRADDKQHEKRTTQVMGMNAFDAFGFFLSCYPSITVTEEDVMQIKPEWCHIIMSAVCSSEDAQNPNNLCCAPKGLNDAMKIPEQMLLSLAEHEKHSQEKIGVKVTVNLLVATRILKSMVYEISVPNKTKITVMYDHPFKAPHSKYADEGITHIEKMLGMEFDKRSDFMYGS